MLKNISKLLKRTLVTNAALGLIALPLGLPQPQPALVAPQEKLRIITSEPKIQTPIKFTYISQGFSSFHPGIDLATKYGTKITPITSGIVEVAGYSPFGYGNEIVINNGNGIKSLYAHLAKIEVKVGQKVELDTEIGLVGITGHSTGPHLHLEIHKNGVAINPLTLLEI